MKNRVLSVVLFLVFLFSFTALAKEGEETSKQTSITGYGEYQLGMPVAELNLEGFVGPIENTSYVGLTGIRDYTKEEEVYFAGRETKVLLSLTTLEGRVECISLAFTNLLKVPEELDLKEFDKWLDNIGYYVKDLRQLIVDRYDPKLKKRDDFSYTYSSYSGKGWFGLLELRDETGNTLTLVWGASLCLNLSYQSARLREVAEAAKKKAREKSESKL